MAVNETGLFILFKNRDDGIAIREDQIQAVTQTTVTTLFRDYAVTDGVKDFIRARTPPLLKTTRFILDFSVPRKKA